MLTNLFKFLPSTVDWCEKNYQLSNYVAEFYNTITGTCIFISIYSFKYHNQDLFNQKIFHSFSINMNNVYNYAFLISVGTVLFHGTLYYPFQLLDELPLILIMTEYMQILSKLHNNLNTQISRNTIIQTFINNSKFFAKIICLYVTLIYFVSHNLQIFTFHTSLKLYELTIFVLLYNISYPKLIFEDNTISCMYNKHKKDIEYYSYKGLSYYILGIFVWLLDKFYCNNSLKLQFHAYWHIFSSIAFNCFNYIILSHIHMYYLLTKNNNQTVQPPSTPKIKTL